jgi:hypothetical protein
VVWRAIWQFLDAILLAAWWLGIGRLLRPDHLRLSRLSLALAAAATVGAAANVTWLNLVRDVLRGVLSSRHGPRGGSPSSWCFPANRKQLPSLPRRDRQHAVVSLAATALFAVILLWPGGNAAFLMAIVTLLGWIAALAARLATAHGHADRKATRPTGGD